MVQNLGTDKHIESRIDKLLQELTLEEKAALTAGLDLWHTNPVERLGIPALKLSDGPNGVRGEARDSHPVTSASFPVGTALAATWNPDLVHRIGAALGEEASTKGVQVLLGPTVNTHRVPVAGRNFECFSEDPHLSSKMAISYIQGVQSKGVAACVKHFVCNDQEFERFTISSEVSERTLHEIYFPAFKAAVTEAGVFTVMSAYNRINGTYASENRVLLIDILKNKWKFDGLVISDWYGTYSEKAATSGCDLEMPGPARWMGKKSLQHHRSPDPELLDDQVRRLLRTLFRTDAFDSKSEKERSVDLPAHRKLIREAGSEAIVLLKNKEKTLPLDPSLRHRIALIGQLASQISFQGGGSSQVTPHYIVQPLEALQEQCLGEIHYAQGYDIQKQPPALDQKWLPDSGDHPGFLTVTYYDNLELIGEPVHRAACRETSLAWFGETADHFDPQRFSLRMKGRFRPPETKEYTLTLALIGRGRVLIDQEIVLDLWEGPSAERQVKTDLTLDASRIYSITIEYTSDLDLRWRMVRLGVENRQKPDLMGEAVELAAGSDIALIVVGLSPDWESEGFDRDSLALPGDQDNLIQQVSRVNPNTVVVVNGGSPVLMPWKESVPAILQSWYLGQESGNALADVIFGKQDPGGRLPTTFPDDLADSPAYNNYPGENRKVSYREEIFVGYRHYDSKGIQPLYPFGHGLSYTSFRYHNLRLNKSSYQPGSLIEIKFDVTNTGSRAGKEVAQLYLRDQCSTLPRPVKELKGFKKFDLAPGKTKTISFTLKECDLSYYDDTRKEWVAETGNFEIMIGRSAENIILTSNFYWEQNP